MTNVQIKRMENLNTLAPRLLGVCSLAIGTLILSLSVAAQTLSPDICAVFSPADVQPIVGAFSPLKPYKAGHLQVCTHSSMKTDAVMHLNLNDLGSAMASTQSNEKFLKSTRDVAQMVEGTVLKDEPGIGDQAFSAIYTIKKGYMRPGVVFNILKNHRLITIEYWHDGDGTETTRTAIRVLAKKAADAL